MVVLCVKEKPIVIVATKTIDPLGEGAAVAFSEVLQELRKDTKPVGQGMSKFLLCECGERIDVPDAQPGQVVECPSCRRKLPIPLPSPEDFLRQMQAPGSPGVFAYVQLKDEGDAPASAAKQQEKPVGWWRRFWHWLSGKKA
jgi:hypothetical protein